MEAKFLGYEVEIVYDDYNRYEILIQDLDELETICKRLENRDTTFEIEHKKKYQLDDGSFVCGDTKHISLDNSNIPKRELLLQKFNNIAQIIYHSNDVKDKDIQECYDILSELVDTNHL